MPLQVAVQMDPLERVNIESDTTFFLMLEAQTRGHGLFVYAPDRLTLDDGRVLARGRAVNLRAVRGDHHSVGEVEVRDLSEADVVLMRQDPPFDMAYITATHMLEHIHRDDGSGTLVVNNPVSVRNAPEKLLVTQFPELMPPTLVTWDIDAIRGFRATHKDIVVKPLFGNGGAGVFLIRHDDPNLNALLEMHFARSREPLMIQRYEPAVREGDKRIVLIDGEAAGAINRVPAAGEARSNMHVGGRPEQSGLTPRDLQICATIGPLLQAQGLIFVGIDVIGDCLTEINVTSPTGIQEINRLDGVKLEVQVWDAIEARLKKRR